MNCLTNGRLGNYNGYNGSKMNSFIIYYYKGLYEGSRTIRNFGKECDGLNEKVELLLTGQQYKKFQEAYYSAILEKYSLSLVDIWVLLVLSEPGGYDTARDIVKVHGIAKSYVSKSINKLVEKGFLEGKHTKDDRRYVHLIVKEEALPVIDAMREQRKKMVKRLFQGVSKEQLELLAEIAWKINANITEMEEFYE